MKILLYNLLKPGLFCYISKVATKKDFFLPILVLANALCFDTGLHFFQTLFFKHYFSNFLSVLFPIILPRFVSIREEQYIPFRTLFILCCRYFATTKIQELHVQKNLRKGTKPKIRETLSPHFLQTNTARILRQSRLGQVSSVKLYSSLSG